AAHRLGAPRFGAGDLRQKQNDRQSNYATNHPTHPFRGTTRRQPASVAGSKRRNSLPALEFPLSKSSPHFFTVKRPPGPDSSLPAWRNSHSAHQGQDDATKIADAGATVFLHYGGIRLLAALWCTCRAAWRGTI